MKMLFSPHDDPRVPRDEPLVSGHDDASPGTAAGSYTKDPELDLSLVGDSPVIDEGHL